MSTMAPPPRSQSPRTAERRLAACRLIEEEKLSFAQAGRAVGASREAVRRWWHEYAQKGRAALFERPSTGPALRLSEEELRGLVNAAAAAAGGPPTLASVLELARTTLGSDISRPALRRQLVAAALWP
jgi:transposase-like protein